MSYAERMEREAERLEAREREQEPPEVLLTVRTRLVGEYVGDGCVNDTGEDY